MLLQLICSAISCADLSLHTHPFTSAINIVTGTVAISTDEVIVMFNNQVLPSWKSSSRGSIGAKIRTTEKNGLLMFNAGPGVKKFFYIWCHLKHHLHNNHFFFVLPPKMCKWQRWTCRSIICGYFTFYGGLAATVRATCLPAVSIGAKQQQWVLPKLFTFLNLYQHQQREKSLVFELGGIGRELASVKLASSLVQLVPSHFHKGDASVPLRQPPLRRNYREIIRWIEPEQDSQE